MLIFPYKLFLISHLVLLLLSMQVFDAQNFLRIFTHSLENQNTPFAVIKADVYWNTSDLWQTGYRTHKRENF